jgi:hypothetical protein
MIMHKNQTFIPVTNSPAAHHLQSYQTHLEDNVTAHKQICPEAVISHPKYLEREEQIEVVRLNQEFRRADQ